MAIKIGLDAGHGLKTAGKQTPDGIKENYLNDIVCDKITTILKDYDVEIIRTDNNEGYTDESLSSRLSKYLNAGVSVFVSIHHNAFTGTWNNATGVEVWMDRNFTADDERLANCIYSRLVKYTGLKGRGIKKEDWAVINQNKVPAVLVEGGFMDSSNDYKVITSDAGQTAYAKAVAEGLVEFLGLTKKQPVVTPVAPKSDGKISGYNIARRTNYLVVYNKGASTGTNIWGTEVAVNSNGVAICDPIYGKGNMAIPAGGYVISGHDIASTWIMSNIKKGSQITISNDVIKVGAVVPVVPVTNTSSKLNIGDEVKLVAGARYTSGGLVPSWIMSKVLYVRDIRSNGDVVISTLKTGAVTGVVSSQYITKNGNAVVTPSVPSQAPTSATPTSTKLNVGDTVKLVSGAKYTSGGTIPSWVFNSTLYLRQIQGENAVISTLKTGAVTGVVSMKYLKKA